MKSESIQVQSEQAIVIVRQKVRHWAVQCRFSIVDQTKMVTAASELARNMWIYGGGGEVNISQVHSGNRIGLRVEFADNGPGIPDIAEALRDGFTSGSGMGLGLGGAKRLVNEFEIESRVNQGTRVTITRWK